MERAHAPDQIFGADGRDAAGGEELLKDGDGACVVGVTKDGEEDDRVGDEEVGVRGWETTLPTFDDAGHGERDDAEGATCGVGCVLEASEVVLQEFVVGIGGVFFEGADDG